MEKKSQAQQLVERIMGRPYGDEKYHGPAGANSNSLGRSRVGRQTRASQFRQAAVFKFIRNGSCTDRSSLARQLNYVGTKSDAIIDPTFRYSEQATLDRNDINRITRKWELSWGDNWRTGNLTNHFVMSFPPGTHPEAVENIVAGVCNEMLSSGDRTFEYIAGVHTDEDHPHAHLIINRVSSDGSLFLMRKGTEFSYETFKEAIVAHGERHGVYLHSSTRFERGLVHRPPTTKQVYDGKEVGEKPEDRKRVLKDDVEFACREIDKARQSYVNISEYCANNDLRVLAYSTEQAAITLEAYQPLTGSLTLTEDQISQVNALDYLVQGYNTEMLDLQDQIAEVIPSKRPELQSRFAEILKQSHPILDRGNELQISINDQSADGLFNSDRLSVSPIDKQALIDTVASICDEYGIDSSELAERFVIGADSAFIENVWIRQDLNTIALGQGVNLENRAGFEIARTALEDIYNNIEDTLISHGWYEKPIYDEVITNEESNSDKTEINLDLQQSIRDDDDDGEIH